MTNAKRALRLLLLPLVLHSCTNNYDIREEFTIIEEPVPLDSTLVFGQILDYNDQVIPNASVEYWYNSQLRSVTTNENGAYRFYVPQLGERVNIKAEANQYLPSLAQASTGPDEVERNITLARTRDLYLDPPDEPRINQNLFQINGQITLVDGTPAGETIVFLVTDFLNTGSSETLAFARTDENGQFQIITPSFSEPALLAAWSTCGINPFLASGITVTENDVDLGILPTDFPSSEEIRFTGEIRTCDGNELVESGNMVITIQAGARSSAYAFGFENGRYENIIPVCSDWDCYDVQIFPTGTNRSVAYRCMPITDLDMTRNYLFCTEPAAETGIVDVNYDGDSFTFQRAEAQWSESEQSWLLYAENSMTGQVLTIELPAEENATGAFEPEWFLHSTILGSDLIFGYQPGSGALLQLIITQNDTDRLSGSFSGNLTNEQDEIVAISGTFEYVIKPK